MMKWLLAVLAAGLCAGAAHAQDEADACLELDWYAMGATDGARGGGGLDRAETRAADCGAAGVEVDFTEYLDGRNAGLSSFCTARNGLDRGRSGKKNEGACPPDTAAVFTAAFDAGRRVYIAEKNLKKARKAVRAAEKKLAAKKRNLTKMRAKIGQSKNDQQRQKRTKKAAQIEKDIRRIETRLPAKRQRLAQAEQAFASANSAAQRYM